MRKSAMGIIFSNMHDERLPSITRNRTMASVPVAARYRMIDFQLSAMTNAHIETIGVIVQKNYRSLLDHLGTGREWDLSRKIGGLTLFPPQSETGSENSYFGRLGALYAILPYLEDAKADIVVLADCDFMCLPDYADILQAHEASGADVTMVCEKMAAGQKLPSDNVTVHCNADGRITELMVDDNSSGEHIQCMNMFIIAKDKLLDYVHTGHSHNQNHFVRDILINNLDTIHINACFLQGYAAQIIDVHSYFESNMQLRNPENLRALFGKAPVYTKVRDEAPTRYAMDSQVSECLIADGCQLEGCVENSVLFRNVTIAKGAVVRNCILMQGTTVEAGAKMDYVITDKGVTITAGKQVSGSSEYPVFVEKNAKV